MSCVGSAGSTRTIGLQGADGAPPRGLAIHKSNEEDVATAAAAAAALRSRSLNGRIRTKTLIELDAAADDEDATTPGDGVATAMMGDGWWATALGCGGSVGLGAAENEEAPPLITLEEPVL